MAHKELILLCCGDRHWNNTQKIYREFKRLRRHGYKVILVIEGEADGADKLCRMHAEREGIQVARFHANWEFYHNAAGPIRNQAQLDFARNLVNGSDITPGGAGFNVRAQHYKLLVLAFHSDISKSKGTKDMVNRAKKAGVKVRIIS